MAPGLSVGYDPATGNEYLSMGATFAPPLRHDRAQWEQAFGRRMGDVETIARLRQEAASAIDARSDAEAAERAARASLEAVTEERDRWEDQAGSPWYVKLGELFARVVWTWPAAVVASVGIVAFVLVRRRKRRKPTES